jgi:hypothetical protein
MVITAQPGHPWETTARQHLHRVAMALAHQITSYLAPSAARPHVRME